MKEVRFKPHAIPISKDDPFKEDLLGRRERAEILTEFVGSLTEPFVLAIDSPWRTGKTTFLKMWMQHLENEGFPRLYFNAWENDFSDSPLVSLIANSVRPLKTFV
jgi:predicted AAA+ superfamily ATPase